MGPEVIRDPRFSGGHWPLVPDCGSASAQPLRPRSWSAFGPRKSAKRSPTPRILGGSKGLQLLRFRPFALVGGKGCIPFKSSRAHQQKPLCLLGFVDLLTGQSPRVECWFLPREEATCSYGYWVSWGPAGPFGPWWASFGVKQGFGRFGPRLVRARSLQRVAPGSRSRRRNRPLRESGVVSEC
jgi:hypothetical protein